MADTARAEAECKEFFDKPDVLQKKIKKLAEMVRKSKHFVAYTGAGISTSAGIADYRSGINTVLATGAGKWAKNAAKKEGKTFKKVKRKTTSIKAYPTPGHMALVGLMQSGHLKYLVSQNTDGLHRRSGIPINQLSELHGNGTLEICDKCGKQYMRDYKCRHSIKKQRGHNHKTGRICSVKGCRGNLCDTIINFGENLPTEPLELAEQNSDKADLYLCLGSSLTVSPACDMPDGVGDKYLEELESVNGDKTKETTHNLVIVNIQKTPLHDKCSLPIHAKIDDVMIGIMKELNVSIPKWFLDRYLKITVQTTPTDEKRKVIISAVDRDGTNATIFKKTTIRSDGNKIFKIINSKETTTEEFHYIVPIWKQLKNDDNDKQDDEKKEEKKNDDNNDDNEVIKSTENADKNVGLTVELQFYGNYKEPNLVICLNDYLDDLIENEGEMVVKMRMDPDTTKWYVGDKNEQSKDKNVSSLWKINKSNDK